MNLEPIEVGQMSAYDVGRRIVVTDQGVAFDGTLTALATTRSDYDFKDRDRITVSIAVKRLDGERVVAEIKLTNLPIGYMVERERVAIPHSIRGSYE